jgi:hypothetical protein
MERTVKRTLGLGAPPIAQGRSVLPVGTTSNSPFAMALEMETLVVANLPAAPTHAATC